MTPSVRPLQLSAAISPTERRLKSNLLQKTASAATVLEQTIAGLLEQTSKKTPEVQAGPPDDDTALNSKAVHSLASSLIETSRPTDEAPTIERSERSRIEPLPGHVVSCPAEALEVQDDGLDSGHYTREPSRSERNGWLKRRHKVSFADVSDTEKPRKDIADDAEDILEAHNALWHKEMQPRSFPPDLGTTMSRVSQVEVEEDGEDILDTRQFQNQSHRGPHPSSRRPDDKNHGAQHSPTSHPSILHAPSSNFQVAASSRPLEVQDLQEQK